MKPLNSSTKLRGGLQLQDSASRGTALRTAFTDIAGIALNIFRSSQLRAQQCSFTNVTHDAFVWNSTASTLYIDVPKRDLSILEAQTSDGGQVLPLQQAPPYFLAPADGQFLALRKARSCYYLDLESL